MTRARTQHALFQSIMDEQHNEYDPTGTLRRQIDRARREMGEKRWAELNQEWLNAETPS